MKVNNGTYPEFFEFVVPGVLLNGIGLLGFCGNILSIIVLSRPQMKSSINCILIGINFDPKLLKSLFLLSKIRLSFSYRKKTALILQCLEKQVSSNEIGFQRLLAL